MASAMSDVTTALGQLSVSTKPAYIPPHLLCVQTMSEWRAATTVFTNLHHGDLALPSEPHTDKVHCSFIAALFKGTVETAQTFVDQANTYVKIGTEPNTCKEDSPCSLTDSHKCGDRDEWSRHLVLIEFDSEGNPISVIVPSWHNELHNEWQQMLVRSKETENGGYFEYPFPISSFEVSHIEQIAKRINTRFEGLDDEKMYLVGNLNSGDTRQKFERPNGRRRRDRYNGLSICMMGGKVDDADYPNGSFELAHSRPASKTAAQREFDEESNNCFKEGTFATLNPGNCDLVCTTQVARNIDCQLRHQSGLRFPEESLHRERCGCMTARVTIFVPHAYLTIEDLNPYRLID
jgi:hypothetical protein